MLKEPMEILGLFPVRKTKQQKQAFRDAVQTYAKTIGYEYREEPGPFGCRNLVIGDPENAKYLVTITIPVPEWWCLILLHPAIFRYILAIRFC